MAAKKRSTTADKDLKKTVKKLRSQRDRADAKAEKWKKKARKLEKSAAQSDAQVKKLTKRLDKATRTSKDSTVGDTSSSTVAPIPAVAAEPADVPEAVDMDGIDTEATQGEGIDTEAPDASEAAVGPDESWTVVQLRAEARSRGLTGLSGKSKAQLLEALS